jgi:hypothetical protein
VRKARTSMPRHWWRRALLLLGVLVLLPRVSLAQIYCPTGPEGWRPVAYQAWTVGTGTPRGIDVAQLPPSATNLAMALVSVEAATIRFAFATPPTSDDGHELAPGERLVLCGWGMLTMFRAIRTSQGSANAQVRISLFQPW